MQTHSPNNCASVIPLKLPSSPGTKKEPRLFKVTQQEQALFVRPHPICADGGSVWKITGAKNVQWHKRGLFLLLSSVTICSFGR